MTLPPVAPGPLGNAGALWLARHAAPRRASGLCYGRLDLPADPHATQQAALALARALPRGVVAVASPLQRCAQLAHALHALRPDLAVQWDARLQEMDFGRWEGQRWNDLPRSEIDAWAQNLAHHAPGGGETLSAMLARVCGALADVRGDTVWITHAGVARCVAWLQAHGHATPTASAWPQAAPAWGQWVRLALRPLPPLAPPPQG